MAKLLKIIARTIGISLEWVLLILIVFAFLIRTSTFQTFMGQIATDYLSSELNTEIKIDKIDIIILNRAQLKGVFIRDLNGDTLASVGTIDVRISDLNLSGNHITISSALVKDGRIGISRDKKTGDFNYGFLVDYFGSDTPPDPSKKPMKLDIEEINLANITLSYDDNRKDHSPYGMDYDHLYFTDVLLKANKFKSDDKGVIGLSIEKFSAKESCGLQLDQLKLSMVMDPKSGILLKRVEIRTPDTRIYASKFNLRAKSMKDFNDFTNKVRFDAVIDSSEIDLHDVSLFVPALEGMDQKIYLSTSLRKPVNSLTLNDFDLRFGSRTVVRGDFVLPDFSDMDKASVNEQISYCFVDLDDVKALHLPKSAGNKGIELQPMIERLAYAELKNTTVQGTMQEFILASNRISTKLGSLQINNGIQFNKLNGEEGGFSFHRTANSNYDVAVDSFQLGQFLANDMLGKVQGEFFLTGIVGQKDVIRLTELAGDIQRFGFNNYGYSNIKVTNGSFINNVFDADIAINDPHLKMTFDGKVDVNTIQKFDFKLDVDQADLGALNFSSDPEAELTADLDIDMKGKSIDDYRGTVFVDNMNYSQGGKKIAVPDLDLTLTRGEPTDQLKIDSEVAYVEINGKMTSANLVNALNNSFAELLPTMIKPVAVNKKKTTHEFFDATIITKNTEELFDIFYPELHVAAGSVIQASYDSQTDVQTLSVKSDEVALIPVAKDSAKVQKQFLQGLEITDTLSNGKLALTLKANKAEYNDSLYVQQFNVRVTNDDGEFKSITRWNQGMENPAEIKIDARLAENNEYFFTVNPSYFTVESQRWEIQNKAQINIEEKRIFIDHLTLERENQFIGVDGILSNNEEDKLSLRLNDVHVEEFSKILDPSLDISGRLDGTVDLRTPFTSLSASGDVVLSQFYMNKEEIGTISVDAVWNPVKEMVSMSGKLDYRENKETFNFYGSFYPMREDNNYSIDLRFRKTDIAFASAFVDPEIVGDIKGKLEGRLKITGKTAAPNINGKVTLNDGSVKVGMLGTTYRMNGDLVFDGDNDFITAVLPVKDQDDNVAVLDVQISHNDFANFGVNLDFWFDEESVYGMYKKPFKGKFMVLNTRYKEGDIYYGKAYASGFANINITEKLVDINVTARTEAGTEVDLPMYGASSVSDFPFIEYTDGSPKQGNQDKNSGVQMELNIKATPDAKINLIFNPKTEDKIDASGYGDIKITIDQNGAVGMVGTYEIVEGGYDMNMYSIKERFILEPGGTIVWTATPYDAIMNLRTYVPIPATVSDILGNTPDGKKYPKKIVKTYMDISGKLSKPNVGLSLEMPTASNDERQILNSAISTPEGLQTQWFFLLSQRRFKPLDAEGGGGFGGAASVLASQANAFLDGLSPGGVDLSVGATGNSGTLTGSKTLGDRIVLTGSFGRTTGSKEDATSSAFVGDMRMDVLFNDDGTFKMSVFNEPNDKAGVGGSENGDYTQGIAISYSEQFNEFYESRLLKFFREIFMRKGADPKKKKKQVPANEVILTPPPPVVKKESSEETPKETDPNK